MMDRKRIGARGSLSVLASIASAMVLAAAPHTAAAQEPPILDSNTDNQLGLTFSPDGATAYWAAWNGEWGSSSASRRIIYESRLQDGAWTSPAPTPFSGEYSDDDPFVSPDGKWLYFVSNRPADENSEDLDGDIWRVSLDEKNRLERLSINSASAPR